MIAQLRWWFDRNGCKYDDYGKRLAARGYRASPLPLSEGEGNTNTSERIDDGQLLIDNWTQILI